MLFRFTGQYTNGHSAINAWGVVFDGCEPSDVPADLVEKFARHPEFEAVVLDPEEPSPVAPTKRRGRPRKAAE